MSSVLFPKVRREYYRYRPSGYRSGFVYWRTIVRYVSDNAHVTVTPTTGTLEIEGSQPQNIVANTRIQILTRVSRTFSYQRNVHRFVPRYTIRHRTYPYNLAQLTVQPVTATLSIEGGSPTFTTTGLRYVFPDTGALVFEQQQPNINNLSQNLITVLNESVKRRLRAARYASLYQRPYIAATRSIGVVLRPADSYVITPETGLLILEGSTPTFTQLRVLANPTEGALVIEGQIPGTSGDNQIVPTAATLEITAESPTVTPGGRIIIGPDAGTLSLVADSIGISGIQAIVTITSSGVMLIESEPPTVGRMGDWDSMTAPLPDWSAMAVASNSWESVSTNTTDWSEG